MRYSLDPPAEPSLPVIGPVRSLSCLEYVLHEHSIDRLVASASTAMKLGRPKPRPSTPPSPAWSSRSRSASSPQPSMPLSKRGGGPRSGSSPSSGSTLPVPPTHRALGARRGMDVVGLRHVADPGRPAAPLPSADHPGRQPRSGSSSTRSGLCSTGRQDVPASSVSLMVVDAEARRGELVQLSKDPGWLHLARPIPHHAGRRIHPPLQPRRAASALDPPPRRDEPRGSPAAGRRGGPDARRLASRACSTRLPGLTGLWQVLGRTSIPFVEMLKLDYMYVTNWSPGATSA